MTAVAAGTMTRPAQVSATGPQRMIAFAGASAMRALLGTLRATVEDEAGFLPRPPARPVIFAFWHNRILAITHLFRRHYPHRERRGVLVLTSPSRDGMWLAEFVRQFGMGSVRGSSSRRGAVAMRELIDRMREGHDIAITPDGPRGPRYTLGPGLVYLAQKTQSPVLPLHARYSACWTLRTWDGFQIPKPFSRVALTIGFPLLVPDVPGADALEIERQNMEKALRAGVE